MKTREVYYITAQEGAEKRYLLLAEYLLEGTVEYFKDTNYELIFHGEGIDIQKREADAIARYGIDNVKLAMIRPGLVDTQWHNTINMATPFDVAPMNTYVYCRKIIDGLLDLYPNKKYGIEKIFTRSE